MSTSEPYTPRHAAQIHARDRRDTALREARLARARRKSAAFDAYTKAIEPLRDAYFAECDAADRAYDETLSEVATWFGSHAAGGGPSPSFGPGHIPPGPGAGGGWPAAVHYDPRETMSRVVAALDPEFDPDA